MNSKISIIVPIYNAEHTLTKCIESLILQKYKNLEIILINDNSIDNSHKICMEFRNKYNFIKYINNIENRGVSASRNIGLENATGDYVMFVDSDDWVDYNYCEYLLKELIKNDAQIAISGFWYHNKINGLEPQRNIFNYKNSIDIKLKNDVIELYSKWHFSALWNKIFIKSIIDKNKIKFNENISIGEDMRFSIDYVKCMSKNKIIVINTPLYHYIHINKNSLWYKNMNQIDTSIYSMEMLFSVLDKKARNNKDNIEKFNNQLLYLYLNYLDFISKQKISEYDKSLKINKILKDSRYKNCIEKCVFYNDEAKLKKMCHVEEYKYWIKLKKFQLIKEYVSIKINKVKLLKRKFLKKCRYIANMRIIKKSRKKLTNNNFSIISQNCIGGVFYHDMNMKFLSPTINLHFEADDFIKFVNNIELYLSKTLVMRYGEQYPVGRLGDINIYFNHYETCEEAYKKWEERKNRIKFEKLIVIMTDRDGFNDDVMTQFLNIKYPKLLFTRNYSSSFSLLYNKKYTESKSIGNIIDNRKFYKKGKLINDINNL